MPNETDQRTSGLAGALQGSDNAFSSPYRTHFACYIGREWRLPRTWASSSPNEPSGSMMSFKLLQPKDFAAKGLQDTFGDNSEVLDFYRKQWDFTQRCAPLKMETDFASIGSGSPADYLVAVTKQRLDTIRAESQRAEEEYEAALSNARKEDTHASLEQLTAQQQRDTGKTVAQRYLAFKAKQSAGE
jgi:hypothetical protein